MQRYWIEGGCRKRRTRNRNRTQTFVIQKTGKQLIHMIWNTINWQNMEKEYVQLRYTIWDIPVKKETKYSPDGRKQRNKNTRNRKQRREERWTDTESELLNRLKDKLVSQFYAMLVNWCSDVFYFLKKKKRF